MRSNNETKHPYKVDFLLTYDSFLIGHYLVTNIVSPTTGAAFNYVLLKSNHPYVEKKRQQSIIVLYTHTENMQLMTSFFLSFVGCVFLLHTLALWYFHFLLVSGRKFHFMSRVLTAGRHHSQVICSDCIKMGDNVEIHS